jgi:DNA polymerase-3 subunit alpha
MLLFCKLATTDIVRDGAPPQIVSLAAELTDVNGNALDFVHTRVRVGNASVKPEAQEVHGISSRMASRDGVSVITALGMLCGLAAQARYLIGHAITFDRDVAVGALLRMNKDASKLIRPGLQIIDTMTAAAPVCRLPSDRTDGAYRWPSLDAACEAILHEQPTTGHRNTWRDLKRAERLYFALRNMNVLEAA